MTMKLFSQVCVCFLKPPPYEGVGGVERGDLEQSKKSVSRQRRWRRRVGKARQQHQSSLDNAEIEGLLQSSDTDTLDSDLDDLDVQFVFKDPHAGRWGYKVIPLKQYEAIRGQYRKDVVKRLVNDIFNNVTRRQSFDQSSWCNVDDDISQGEDDQQQVEQGCGTYEIIDLDFVDLNNVDLVAELRKGGIPAALAAADAEAARQMSQDGADSAFESRWQGVMVQELQGSSKILNGDVLSGEETGSVKGGSPRSSEVPSLDPQRFRRLYNFTEDTSEVSGQSVFSSQESTSAPRMEAVAQKLGQQSVVPIGYDNDDEAELQLGQAASPSDNDDDGSEEANQDNPANVEKETDVFVEVKQCQVVNLVEECEITIAEEEQQQEELKDQQQYLQQEKNEQVATEPSSGEEQDVEMDPAQASVIRIIRNYVDDQSSGLDSTSSGSDNQDQVKIEYHEEGRTEMEEVILSRSEQHVVADSQEQQKRSDEQGESSSLVEQEEVAPEENVELPLSQGLGCEQVVQEDKQDAPIVTLSLEESSSSSEDPSSVHVLLHF
eukprot:TRINITY_DN284_c0_g1_i1.p1 TRINITY_DN284_c0_g1~~TRINITY_DN284_c0_g1_i1.p1  ORF type:complete len:602 (-),score=99.47 TRINITY_DN284_c0_g1_i1:520-2163(-)